MPKIQVLDKHVAELIAAGEVVERPSSVIKELMENTIDAGAKHVTVEIRDGGVSYMRITDDGCGIRREDVATAFLRHATSKVHREEDLSSIMTLGFRGEALASVAAVSKVELTTCAAGEIVGTRYVIHGGEEILIEDAGCAQGSTFVVEDLFYNIPARMKFLKKDVSEGNAVAGVVERLALSHPEVAVRFIRNGRTELQTSGDGQVLSCIHSVLGKSFAASLLPVDYTMGGIRVSGYICKPESGRPNRTMQHFFVNDRYVKTQTGMIATERAYKGMMMVGRFPSCVLYIRLPTETVDANVHPAKIEVRFINEKPVFDAIYYGVRSALESRSDIRQMSLHTEQRQKTEKVPFSMPTVQKSVSSPAKAVDNTPLYRPTTPENPKAPSFLDLSVDDDKPVSASLNDSTRRSSYTPAPPVLDDTMEKTESAVYQPPAVTNVSEPHEQSHITDSAEAAKMPVNPPASELIKVESKEALQREQPTQMDMNDKPALRVVGEIFTTYILVQMGDSLFVIDKHAAHERILYNKLKAQARVDEQLLLTPVPVTVSREEHIALLESVDELKQAGITIEDFGGHCVLVRSFPLILSGTDIDSTIREIAAGLTGGCRQVQSSKLEWIYHSSACRAAIKAGDYSRPAEWQDLAEQVLLDDTIRFCPHGRPVCFEMTQKEIEKQFGRIV